MRKYRVLSAAFIAALLLAGCGSDDDADSPTTTTQPLATSQTTAQP